MTVILSPFKFLDAYTREDRGIFFGREREIEELYQKVFGSRILLLYGISGTGKTSLINCGLANKFAESDWLPIHIRRGKDINESLVSEIQKASITRLKEKGSIQNAIQSVYLDHFKPIYIIFDQFKEVFIFGDRSERERFIHTISEIVNSDLQCRCLFSIREEYLAGVTEFESSIPEFLVNRMRVEKMTHQNATEVIEGPCRVNGINVEEGFSQALLHKLNPDTNEVSQYPPGNFLIIPRPFCYDKIVVSFLQQISEKVIAIHVSNCIMVIVRDQVGINIKIIVVLPNPVIEYGCIDNWLIRRKVIYCPFNISIK